MKKTNLKKLLAIALCLMMCASALTLFASADTATAPTFAKTIYVKSTGNNDNDGLTEATAVYDLVTATKKVGENGGEIIVLDDITYDITGIEVTNAGHRMYYADGYSTIYIHGKQKADNTYPTVLFDSTSTAKAPILELGSPLAIYDLGIGTVNSVNLWISANGYPITIGENVTRVQPGKSLNICAGQQNAASSGLMNTETSSVVNIFSGTWGDIYGASMVTSPAHNGANVNFFGGTIRTIYGYKENGNVSGDVKINVWGGTVSSKITSFAKEGVTNTLNIYNDCIDAETKATILQGVFAEGGTGTVNSLTGTAPDFWTVSACTITPPAPPTFEDDPTLGDDPTIGDDPNPPADTNNTDADTKAPETKAPETKAPETEAPAEEKGCGGVVGASALVIATVMGAAVVVGKKREE